MFVLTYSWFVTILDDCIYNAINRNQYITESFHKQIKSCSRMTE